MRISNKKLYFILALIFVLSYIVFLGAYPLLDVDETRYVDMSKRMFLTKDFLTLYLNGDYFFEKPPLFFWVECLSFKMFGYVSEFSARIPFVILSLLPAVLLFLLSKKVKDTKFAFVNVIVLITSFEYIFMTKMAILDSVFTSFVTGSCLCLFYTYFCDARYKKFFVYLTYFFSALAVLAKGIPGIVIPVGCAVMSSFIFKFDLKDLKHHILGSLIFLAVVLPWHVIMLKTYPQIFFDEYIIKHHILRFLGSEIINRNKPFYFYILTLLWGLFPYTIILFSSVFELVKKKILSKNLKINFSNMRKYDKFVTVNILSAIFILLFFSASGAKLVTYILPIYPFISVLIGKVWYEFIEFGENCGIIKKSQLFLDFLLLSSAFSAFFLEYFLPAQLYKDIRVLQYFCIVLIIIFAAYNLWTIKNDKKFLNFLSTAFFIAVLSAIGTPMVYEFDYSFGQNDLMRYAKQAKNMNYTISTYKTGSRYSLLYYSDMEKIDFHLEDPAWLDRELQKKNNLLIMRNKDIDTTKLRVCQGGVKYSVVCK